MASPSGLFLLCFRPVGQSWWCQTILCVCGLVIGSYGCCCCRCLFSSFISDVVLVDKQDNTKRNFEFGAGSTKNTIFMSV